MMTEKLKKIPSPLIPEGEAVYESALPVNPLVRSYRKSLGIDVSDYFSGLDQVEVYRCERSGYRFYYPFSLEGRGSLYEHLQQFDWYYMPWKWEYEEAANWVGKEAGVLEIGCGKGFFLDHINRTLGARVTGLELNEETAQRREGLQIINKDLSEFSTANPSSFDLVCSFQVLEHVAGVHPFLEKATHCLKPGGHLILSVPNNESFIRYDRKACLNMPPHHMGLWNEKALCSLTEIFPLQLEKIIFEPLQPYHEEYYFRTMNRAKYGYLGYKMKKILYKMGLKQYYLKKIRNKAHQIRGHSIMGVFTRR